MRRWLPPALCCAIALSTAAAPAAPPLPQTPKRPVEDVYWGVTVRDDYRWLEAGRDAAVRAWSDSQNAVARALLDALPMRAAVLRRIEALTQSPAPSWSGVRLAGGLYFALEDRPPRQQPMLVCLRSLDDLKSERVLVDPQQIDPSGQTTIDFFEPTRDGTKVAVSLSQGGTEEGTVYVWDVRTGRRLGEEVPGVQRGTAGGSVAWTADGTGFWRTRYPARGERPEADLDFYQQVYFHRLGANPRTDVFVVGRDFPKIAEVQLRASEDGRWLLADVADGDGGEHEMWLASLTAPVGTGVGAPGAGAFRRLSTLEDRVVDARFGPDVLYLLSRKDAPNGKVLRLDLSEPVLERAAVVVPEGDGGIEWLRPAGDLLYVEEILGGPSRVRAFGGDGTPRGTVPLPDPSTVNEIVATGGGSVVLEIERYTEPGRWVRYDPAGGAPAPTALTGRSPARFEGVEVRREWAVSRDGTKVPLTILVRKDVKLDGTAPALLYGYGGFGISQTPDFSASRQVWLEQGGVYAIAHLRGGAEFGDAWHAAGKLTRKQNVFDDFAACARWLVEHRYASPARLACQGGSNGGLLMGAMITQHPELFRAVVSSVGIYDMLRVELAPNGLFNVTEFGTVKDSAQFAALHAYSPYHRVVDGTRYPAVLLSTGANDPRVDPMQSRKMTARLQAVGVPGRPVLLRADATTGHVGSPLSARNALRADQYAFLFAELGVKWRRP